MSGKPRRLPAPGAVRRIPTDPTLVSAPRGPAVPQPAEGAAEGAGRYVAAGPSSRESREASERSPRSPVHGSRGDSSGVASPKSPRTPREDTSPASRLTIADSSCEAVGKTRAEAYARVLEAPVADLDALRDLVWNGVPPTLRGDAWRLLTGTAPAHAGRREAALARKRDEYWTQVGKYFGPSLGGGFGRSDAEQNTLRQICKDIDRTGAGVPLLRSPPVQRALERILFVWAVRHPAAGYVQGINDILLPIFCALAYADARIDLGSRLPAAADPGNAIRGDDGGGEEEPVDPIWIGSGPAPADAHPTPDGDATASDPEVLRLWTTCGDLRDLLRAIEADAFWVLSRLLDGIQDTYTEEQPGLKRQLARMTQLLPRIDPTLSASLDEASVNLIDIANRWINCLLVREFPLPLAVRIFDTALADAAARGGRRGAGGGASEWHTFVCLSLLVKLSPDLKGQPMDVVLPAVRNLPDRTALWSPADVAELLSHAYVLQSIFQDSSSASSTAPVTPGGGVDSPAKGAASSRVYGVGGGSPLPSSDPPRRDDGGSWLSWLTMGTTPE